MTTKIPRLCASILPYRKILPDSFVCPQPEHIRDSMLQSEPVAESDHLLRDHYAEIPGTLVDSGGFVFYDPQDMRRGRVRPDLYIVFGVDTQSVLGRQGYITHEAGKAPDFALEVASHTTWRTGLRRKPALYARIGIREYWRFDPTGGDYYGYALAGDILVEGEYQPVELTIEEDGMIWGYSPALDLCLCAKEGRLIYYDRKTGRYLQNITEERAAHLRTAAELDHAAAERDAERAARQASEAEVARLREQLHRLQGQ